MKKERPATGDKGGEHKDRKRYGCADYRQERMLLGLKMQLEQEGLSREERDRIEASIAALEAAMGMD